MSDGRPLKPLQQQISDVLSTAITKYSVSVLQVTGGNRFNSDDNPRKNPDQLQKLHDLP